MLINRIVKSLKRPSTNGHKEHSAVDAAPSYREPIFSWKRCCIMAWFSILALVIAGFVLNAMQHTATMRRLDSIETKLQREAERGAHRELTGGK